MILVTGATGFLGRNLVPRLLRAGYEVRIVARQQSEVAPLLGPGVEVATVDDIGDVAGLRAACAGCEAVIHAAALFRMWGPLLTFWQTNVAGTAAVLEAMAAAGVQRLVHVSSVVVVGRVEPGRVVDEVHSCRPLDHYQRTKLEAERLVLAHARQGALAVTVVRPGALYGPWGTYAFNRLFFVEPLRGWRIKVNGGRHITFPAYSGDVADGIIAALEKGGSGELYNLSGESLSHNAVNEIVSDLAGISRRRFNVPTAAVLALARGLTALSRFTQREPFYPIDLAHYVFQDWHVSSEKARAELGFAPRPFVEGARATLQWYREQGLF
ncbi:MAG: NAD-dependent epimerase/dehydratase family protein [Anaerolineae bacterium]|nr:NAD-dependent epimerase/dehydratase family protein [Anaerolineae bacterium]